MLWRGALKRWLLPGATNGFDAPHRKKGDRVEDGFGVISKCRLWGWVDGRMTTFRLDNLEPLLLEKIFTKFRGRSYGRLQQTCHWVDEFIRRSRTISVPVSTYGSLLFKDSSWQFYINFKINEEKSRPVDALHGARLAVLQPHEKEGEFESLCAVLKKYCITCANLRTVGRVWTAEQCAKLIDITKPVKVNLRCDSELNPARLDALFRSKILRNVYVILHSHEIATAGVKLMSAFPEVTLRLLVNPDPFGSLRTVLQILRSNNFPNLYKFDFIISTGRRRLPTKRQFEEEFRGFNLKVGMGNRPWIGATTDLPQKPGFACLMMFEPEFTTVTLLS